MGKWGGYHTDFAHLARGFAGNDRALAQARRRGAARRGAAGREALGRPAPRVPQPAPRGRHPPADRGGRGAVRARPAEGMTHSRAVKLPSTALIAGKAQTVADPRERRDPAPAAARPAVPRAARARPLGRRRPPPATRPPRRAIRTGSRSSTSPGRSPSARSTSAPTRSRTRCATEGVGAGDRVAIMCRNHRGWVESLRRREQARGARAVPQHRVLRPAAHRRRRARGPGGGDLRRRSSRS